MYFLINKEEHKMATPEVLYHVEHADGSGPMSIPLPLDEAREFAQESNLPFKIESGWNIQPDQELFVVSETHCRSDISRDKFTIKFHDLKKAIDLRGSPIEFEDEISAWLDSFNDNVAELFNILQLDWDLNDDNALEALLVNGRICVRGEETDFGIGVTGDGAVQAFFEISGPITYDAWS